MVCHYRTVLVLTVNYWSCNKSTVSCEPVYFDVELSPKLSSQQYAGTMNDTDELIQSLTALKIPKTHVTVGVSNLLSHHKDVRSLLVNRRLPDVGWTDHQIQNLLYLLSTLDTNNKSTTSNINNNTKWCGVGEREGRVFSSLVAQRHFGLSHGVGRSGDIAEPQPKAVGSSIMHKLTVILALDAIRRGSGLKMNHGILLPVCTGMSMALVLSSLREQHRDKKIVLWSRIDQKSCFKAISAAGLTCVVVQTKREGDAVVTDLEAMKTALETHQEKVLAVITTTSCFAPRVPDAVDQVAKLCAEFNVSHVINNAYGLQCSLTSKLINRACTIGRVDAVVCSTDKNFLVPVGGAVVLSHSEAMIASIGKIYAGRASGSPMIDLFITLLSMGLNGYKALLEQRQRLLAEFPERLGQVATKYGERLLTCPSNTVSFGITLDGLARPKSANESEDDYLKSVEKDISRFGAMLFSRCVSGTRVVPRGSTKVMGGQTFQGFGSSVNDYPHAYMTAAVAIGVNDTEIDEFLKRLEKTLKEFKKKALTVK